MVSLFLVSWLLRMSQVNFVPSAPGLVFSFVGIAIILVTASLGGEMVYRPGVAPDEGANLDPPSSLLRRPALGTAMPGSMNTAGVP